jgi:acetate kinase
MTTHILVLNAGSSSLKFAVFEAATLEETWRGQISGMGSAPKLVTSNGQQNLPGDTGFAEGLSVVMAWLEQHGLSPASLCGVGHRIVHGGTRFVSPLVITPSGLHELEQLRALAPLHLPFGLGVLRNTQKLMPHVQHVACFDTAFHATQPELATRLPLPRTYFEKGYRRYGFHGLNYEHVVDAMPKLTGKALPRRIIAAHLGSGASMCAIKDGASIATTMGYSTADGLIMGTRTGSIDPGVLVALLRDEGLSPDALEDLLYRQSGLLGLSGISADMKVLLESQAPEAQEAVAHYCYSAARHAASLVAAMGGVDAIVFTGGVGENAAPVRQRICAQLQWLNVPDDAVHVVAANEERTIARHVLSCVSQ